MQEAIFKRLTFLLGIYFIFSFGFIFSHGFYNFYGSLLIILSISLFFFFLIKPNLLPFEITSKKFFSLLSYALFLNINLTFLLYGGLYQTNKEALKLSLLLLKILLFFSFLLLCKIKIHYLKYLIYFLIGLWLSLQILMVISSSSPKIDVYEFLKNGALNTIKGHNPYSLIYNKTYFDQKPDCYAYLPFMIFYTIPFVFLLNDPRYAFIFAQMVTFYLLVFKFHWQNKKFGEIFSLLIASLILFQPLSLYITEQSYTEPLIVLEILLFYYFLNNKSRINGFILGILLATKQYLIFILPFFPKLKQFVKKYFFQIVFTGGCLIIPFFIANPKDFVHDIILTQYLFPPRYEGLTLFSILFYKFGLSYSVFYSLPIWVCAGIFLYKNKTLNYILKLTLFFLIFFYFNKWAFINYYYLIANMLLLSIIYEYNIGLKKK